jgi:glycolate oxidase FAD binding subunit
LVRPAVEWELANLVREAAGQGVKVEIIGGGSKRQLGRATNAERIISTSSLRAITLYEPNEMVISALAGTPLEQIEQELARKGQMLPFEPTDLGPVLGAPSGQQTIGGVVATAASGSRRVSAGALRDHLIGARAINGRGEEFKSGGRVMKNVTGYDVARSLAGSYGTLAAITEATLKVQPIPEETATVALLGLDDQIAVEVMCRAMGTPFDVSGAVHIQNSLVPNLRHATARTAGKAITALRLETFKRFVRERTEKLKALLAPYGNVYVLDTETSLPLWSELRQLTMMQGKPTPLWRLSVAPTVAPAVVHAISRLMAAEAFYDWSGGLVWLSIPDAVDAGASDVRRVIAQHGGHATLIRAAPAVRASIDVFQPLEPGVERITRGLKMAFDPAGVLNPGRMYATL